MAVVVGIDTLVAHEGNHLLCIGLEYIRIINSTNRVKIRKITYCLPAQNYISIVWGEAMLMCIAQIHAGIVGSLLTLGMMGIERKIKAYKSYEAEARALKKRKHRKGSC